MKCRLGEIEKIVCEKKECKYGKRNVLKGKTVVSTLEVLVELEMCETDTKLKKQKGGLRGRRTQAQAIQEIESSLEENDKAGEMYINSRAFPQEIAANTLPSNHTLKLLDYIIQFTSLIMTFHP